MTFSAQTNRAALAVVALAASLLVANGPLRACLWDADTFSTEAKGLHEVVRAVTGRFDRNPPLFYELRLKNAASRIESDPDDLAAYDDAAVSCDRLGRGDDAIAWAERKRVRLDDAEAHGRKVDDHRYRYLANVGTFWVHRWLKDGADRSRLDQVKTARDFIARAIALNPDAHFGRERYQLAVLDWIITPPKLDPAAHSRLPVLIQETSAGKVRVVGDPRKAVEGLSGLVILGNAWESVDVFNALTVALEADGERTSLAFMSRWRALELAEAGKGSLLPDAPKGDALARRLWEPMMAPKDVKSLEEFYKSLRRAADERHEARTAYMMPRLEAGSHPDTDSRFWDGFTEPAPLIDELSLLADPTPPRVPLLNETTYPSAVALGVAAAATLLILLRRPLARLTGRRPGPSDSASCAA